MCARTREGIKEWRNKKRKEKIGEKKKKGGHYRHFSFYTVRRSCFAKRFPKRIQLSHRIRFTSTATAGAATARAEALRNALNFFLRVLGIFGLRHRMKVHC
jgi:hypothetical protein